MLKKPDFFDECAKISVLKEYKIFFLECGLEFLFWERIKKFLIFFIKWVGFSVLRECKNILDFFTKCARFYVLGK